MRANLMGVVLLLVCVALSMSFTDKDIVAKPFEDGIVTISELDESRLRGIVDDINIHETRIGKLETSIEELMGKITDCNLRTEEMVKAQKVASPPVASGGSTGTVVKNIYEPQSQIVRSESGGSTGTPTQNVYSSIVRESTPILSRSVTRSTMDSVQTSNCPGGVCPTSGYTQTTRSSNFQLSRPRLFRR